MGKNTPIPLLCKNTKKGIFSKPFHGRIFIVWNPFIYIFICPKIKKITIGNFLSLDACYRPMWPGNKYFFVSFWQFRVIHFPPYLKNHKQEKCHELYCQDELKQKLPKTSLLIAEETFAWQSRLKRIMCSQTKTTFLFTMNYALRAMAACHQAMIL